MMGSSNPPRGTCTRRQSENSCSARRRRHERVEDIDLASPNVGAADDNKTKTGISSAMEVCPPSTSACSPTASASTAAPISTPSDRLTS